MSHFTVVVIGDDVDGQLEPYNENTSVEPYWTLQAGSPQEWYAFAGLVGNGKIPEGADMRTALAAAIEEGWAEPEEYRITAEGALEQRSTYNPQSKWDWWVIGGRWEGFFLHLDGRRVDQLLNQDWDRITQRELARVDAATRFDTLERVVKGLPHPAPFPQWVERLEVDMPREEALNQARRDYHEHPFIKALTENDLMPWLEDPLDAWHLNAENPRESYLTSAMLGCAVPFAYVKDGEWHEKGQMGWFGMAANEQDEDAWAVEVNRVYDSLDDEMLTNCDCHI
jgi:hypothetical protein